MCRSPILNQLWSIWVSHKRLQCSASSKLYRKSNRALDECSMPSNGTIPDSGKCSIDTVLPGWRMEWFTTMVCTQPFNCYARLNLQLNVSASGNEWQRNDRGCSKNLQRISLVVSSDANRLLVAGILKAGSLSKTTIDCFLFGLMFYISIPSWTDLANRLKTKRAKQEAEWLPVLESRLKKMEEATEITDDIQISMNEWWVSEIFSSMKQRLMSWRHQWIVVAWSERFRTGPYPIERLIDISVLIDGWNSTSVGLATTTIHPLSISNGVFSLYLSLSLFWNPWSGLHCLDWYPTDYSRCNEPGKLIETGRTANGKTLEEWRSAWNRSLTMCRKKV